MKISCVPTDFLLAAGTDLAAEVAARLLGQFWPFLAVRRLAAGEVLWYVFEVDDALIERLSRGGNLVDALDLHEPQGNAVVELRPKSGLESLPRGWKPDRPVAVVDNSASWIRGVGVPGPVPENAVFPSIESSKPSVAEGQTVEIKLSLSSKSPFGASAPLAVDFDEEAPSTEVVAVVDSDSFARPATETWEKRFTITRALEVSPLTWAFKVRASGARPRYDLRITFFCRGHVAGRTTYGLPASGVSDPIPGGASGGAVQVDPTATPAPRTMMIGRAVNGFEIRLFANGSAASAAIPWVPTSDQYFEELQTISDNHKGFQDVVDLGFSLHADLSSTAPAVVDWLEAPSARGQPLLIEANMPHSPFEILQLDPPSNGPLLGIDRPVLRALGGAQALSGKIDVAKIACIRPKYEGVNALPSAEDEEADLRARVTSLDRVANSGELDALLGRDDVKLIHFAGHADGNPAQLVLEDGVVRPTRFRPSSALLKQAHPFFFVNGCRAGLASSVTAGPAVQTNMALMLIAGGCCGLVAPLIRVLSPAAKVAARAFYDALGAGQTVGAAMQTVRALAQSTPASDDAASLSSYLAYAPIDLALALHR